MGTKTSHKGFTLIELMVVIVILGILASVLLGGLRGCDGLEPEHHTITVIDKYSGYNDLSEMTEYYVSSNHGEYTVRRQVWGRMQPQRTYNVVASPYLIGSGYTITSATEVPNAGQ